MDVEVPPGYYSGHYIGDTPNSSASERTLFPPQFRKHSLCQQLPAVTYKVLPLVIWSTWLRHEILKFLITRWFICTYLFPRRFRLGNFLFRLNRQFESIHAPENGSG
jgi:hypothetical protein